MIADQIFGSMAVAAFFFFLFGVPVILTGINFYKLFGKKRFKSCAYDFITLIYGSILTLLADAMLGEQDYWEPIVLGGADGDYHTSISTEYDLSIFLPYIITIIALLILSASKKIKPPLQTATLIACVFPGNIFAVFHMIQLAKHMDFFVCCIYLFYINLFMCSIRIIRNTIKWQTDYIQNTDIQPKNKFMEHIYIFLRKSTNWYLISFALLLPILCLLDIVLVLFGQTATGFIKAFTMTADWTFSTQIPPPPAEYDGHYLCTVAAGGHEKIVKPTRLGIRQNTKIIVNRQLCIANAFEDLIQEKFPAFHKKIRNFYDTHGYPLSQKITTRFRADLVYIAMKPLEWLFLIFLYTFDISPEDRIARQYTYN